jgi:hypothetical protein
MEAVTGVSLFGFVLQEQPGTLFSLETLWREVEKLKDPGPAPTLVMPVLQPSPDARRVGGNETTRNVVGGMVALSLAGIAISGYAKDLSVVLFGLAVASFFGVRVLLDNSAGMQRYKLAFQTAEARWKIALKDWESKAGPSEFQTKKSSLFETRRQLLGIPSERLRKLDELNQQRRQRQLERFLDQFKIDDASIESIGPGRTRTLESYGIETAADIVTAKIEVVPGFGSKLCSNLIAWRETIEDRFRFDPAQGVNPQDIAKVEHDIVTKQRGLQVQLQTGFSELKALLNRIDGVRRGMRSQVEAVQREFAQASVDYAAVRRT